MLTYRKDDEKRIHLGTTWIDCEELAYNTYSGAHSGSNRHGRVRYPDGQIRSVVLGVPDSYSTIPAHGRVKGKYVSGFVTVSNGSHLDEYRPYGGEFVFHVCE